MLHYEQKKKPGQKTKLPLPAISIGTVLNNSQVTQAFIRQRLLLHKIEVLACLFMDMHYHLIAFEELFYGTQNETIIEPAKIVKRCFFHQANLLILAHNHPGGNPAPSELDKQITKRMQEGLAFLDIQVIDHVIITQTHNFSFAEEGMI
jgi:DNA repair protein RadC